MHTLKGLLDSLRYERWANGYIPPTPLPASGNGRFNVRIEIGPDGEPHEVQKEETPHTEEK